MPGTTPEFGLPYPLDGEVQAASDIKNLADVVEGIIGQHLTPVEVVLATKNGWSPNPSVPITLTITGKIVVCTGEVYKASTTTAAVEIASIPAAYRPKVQRTRTKASSRLADTANCFVTAWDDGRLEIEGATNRSTTPGWNFNLTWIRA